MKWNKYSFKTTSDRVDILSALLADAGIEGIEVEDHQPLSEEDTKGMFIDILPDMGEDDGTAVVSFYLDPDREDLEDILKEAGSIVGEDTEITQSQTKDADWINNWKEFFHPLTIGNILIKPTWEEIPEEDKEKILIEIDPGTAFGTGGHETTQLCITQLEKYISWINKKHRPVEVLDVGTGSGILGICALRLGASHVFGTDLDDNAIEAVADNMKSNAIMDSEFQVVCGNIIDDAAVQDEAGYGKYDIAVANILAPVIIALVPVIPQHLKQGGYFITSGIIDTKEEEVLKAFRASKDLRVLEVNHQGEWVNITAIRL